MGSPYQRLQPQARLSPGFPRPLRRMTIQEKLPLLPRRPRDRQKFVLVVHGGAGTISRETSTPERQALYKAALKTALEAGYTILREGGEAMDAAVAAVTVLEGRCFRIGSGYPHDATAQTVLSSTRAREPSSIPLGRYGLPACTF